MDGANREWTLVGPDSLRLSVKEVAAMWNYEAKTWRALVRAGRVPPPRGFGQEEFYTGLDVAIITEMMGRWMPQDAPEEPAANSPKVPQTGRKVPESARTSVSEE